MDLVHRKPQHSDTRTGRDCGFCRRTDPDFSQRKPMDRLVGKELDDTAAAHLTEDGYVKHRMLEMTARFGTRLELVKSGAA
jgi:hypothetical protein